VRFEGF
jgi:hypothetical protein